MATSKITLAIVSLLTVCVLQACNGTHDKSGMDTQSGQPVSNSSTSGNDSSHTTDNRRQEVSGIAPKTGSKSAEKNANGSTTAQGQTGADSAYQKSSQKSMR